MNIAPYLKHLPTIEGWITEHRLDALVCGMGPTAWLLPWLDQKVLDGIRMFGCHDGCRIMPMHDLVVMDPPVRFLHPDTQRHQEIIKSRPRRLWVFEPNWAALQKFIPQALHSITTPLKWGVWRPDRVAKPHKTAFLLENDPPHTMAVSPTGMTTLAWRVGCRRIGVIGTDMMRDHHDSFRWCAQVDAFFVKMAQQAHERGGCVVNLSPITSLRSFAAWKPSTSGSAPTVGSVTPVPSECSNTASASTPPVP